MEVAAILTLGIIIVSLGLFKRSQKLAQSQTHAEHLESQLGECKSQKELLEQKMIELERENAGLLEKARQREEMWPQLKIQFENLAHGILEKNAQTFKTESVEKMADTIKPFKERLDEFRKAVEDNYSQASQQTFSLKEQIELMMKQTEMLKTALRSDVKKQGLWGEIKLERILESSGLERDRDYILQARGLGLKNTSEHTVRPDVVVLLPDRKHLVIDAKVSLKPYLELIENNSPSAQKTLLTSIKKHIDDLSGKRYELNQKLISPEFTLLFFPLEGALSLVVDREIPQAKQNLVHYAWDKSIVIATPSTLMATLKTAASLWKNVKQQEHAREIAGLGGKLHDQLVSFVDQVKNVKTRLRQADDSCQKSLDALEGRNQLVDNAKKLAGMGAKTTKSF